MMVVGPKPLDSEWPSVLVLPKARRSSIQHGVQHGVPEGDAADVSQQGSEAFEVRVSSSARSEPGVVVLPKALVRACSMMRSMVCPKATRLMC